MRLPSLILQETTIIECCAARVDDPNMDSAVVTSPLHDVVSVAFPFLLLFLWLRIVADDALSPTALVLTPEFEM